MHFAIVGHFGGNRQFTDGQTVKTVAVSEALQASLGSNCKIHTADTYYLKKNPLKFVGELFRCFICDKKIIILLSKNGRRVLFPVFYFTQKYMGKEIYHYAIGGRLADEVRDIPGYQKYVSSFSGNWMESHLLVDRLRQQNIENAIYVPNFKRLKILNQEQMKTDFKEPYHFCTFSRVMEQKGISDAVAAVVKLNKAAGEIVALLDIYGPIEEDYRNAFETLMEMHSSCCRYCGVAPSYESVAILKDYYMLLFPTKWKGEGMPGTIIDSLFAGLPVIARRWQYCDEMLTDGQTGFIYDYNQPEMLYNKIKYAIEHVSEVLSMKQICLQDAQKYTERTVVSQIINLMGLKDNT